MRENHAICEGVDQRNLMQPFSKMAANVIRLCMCNIKTLGEVQGVVNFNLF